MTGALDRLARATDGLERRGPVLGIVKIVNVGLAMLWGFAVTFVFVRLLPLHEFKSFLLLVAFANFTISADFGFSGIIYARLRRHRLREGSDFRMEEMAVLLAFMGGVVGLGGALIVAGIAGGQIATAHPVLFVAFYLLSAMNIFALLPRRAMAAIDHNLMWEAMDMVRRGASLALLLATLAGLSILLSVLIQASLTLAVLTAGLVRVHRVIGMRAAHWWPRRDAAAHVLGTYRQDLGATMALTLSDVAAYNAPYFTLAAASHDPRPLLVFDFVFKMSRALTSVIRALVETGLPRLTAAFHGGATAALSRGLLRMSVVSLGGGLALGLFLLAVGGAISRIMFDGKAMLAPMELALLLALFAGLSLMCVSTFVHNGIGRFVQLLPPSFAFLAGSLLSVPVGAALARAAGIDFSRAFLVVYAATHVLVGLWHGLMLRRIGNA